jgi:hypothetical protein
MTFRTTPRRGYNLFSSKLINYLLRENFLENDAAPITSPLPATPGPGQTVWNNAALWEVVNGVAQTTASSAGTLPIMSVAGGYPRAAGMAFSASVAQNPQGPGPNETVSPIMGWGNSTTAVTTPVVSGLFFQTVSGLFTATELGHATGTTPTIDVPVVSTYYDFCFVLRNTGSFSIIGNKIAFIHKQDTTTPMYPVIGQIGANRHTPQIKNVRVGRLGGSWLSDTGIATSILSGARNVGDTFIHEPNSLWVEFVLTTIPSAGNVEIDIRRQDANNKWMLQVTSAGAYNLVEVVSGTPTIRLATTATTGDRLICIMDGANAKLLRWRSAGSSATTTYTSVSTFTTQTQGELISLGTGGAVSDIEAYPRILTGSNLAWITALRA